MNDDKDDIGYGKPPKRSQFQKGKSGNAKGRPKGQPKLLQEQLLAELLRKIEIKENGRVQTITKSEAVFKTIVNKSLQGDNKAMALLIQLMSEIKESQKEDLPPQKIIVSWKH